MVVGLIACYPGLTHWPHCTCTWSIDTANVTCSVRQAATVKKQQMFT